MQEYRTFAEMEALLLTAIGLPGESVKSIADASGIRVSTLYNWKLCYNRREIMKNAGRCAMPKKENQKLKLLMVKSILEEQTDAARGITMDRIIEPLGTHGIEAARRSVYDDIGHADQGRGHGLSETAGEEPFFHFFSSAPGLTRSRIL